MDKPFAHITIIIMVAMANGTIGLCFDGEKNNGLVNVTDAYTP
jgi:hypothetical protein